MREGGKRGRVMEGGGSEHKGGREHREGEGCGQKDGSKERACINL